MSQIRKRMKIQTRSGCLMIQTILKNDVLTSHPVLRVHFLHQKKSPESGSGNDEVGENKSRKQQSAKQFSTLNNQSSTNDWVMDPGQP